MKWERYSAIDLLSAYFYLEGMRTTSPSVYLSAWCGRYMALCFPMLSAVACPVADIPERYVTCNLGYASIITMELRVSRGC